MFRNICWMLCAVFGLSCVLSIQGMAVAQSQQKRPNIVVIITDDQGYADLSAFDHVANDVQTPNMDRLAAGGVLCTQAYVSAPVCSPSRAGWNTGLYQQRWNPAAGWNPGLPADVTTIAEYLKDAGYVTGKVGKSDYGTGYHSLETREYPLNHGFDEFLGFSAHAHDFFLMSEDIEKRTPDPHGNSATLGQLQFNRTLKSIESGYTTEIFTDQAIDFLQRHREEPFFLTVSYNAVHHLIHQVPEKYLKKLGVEPIPDYVPETMGKYKDYYNKYNQLGDISDADMRKYYLANLNCLDDNIGRLIDAMDDLDLADDTFVIFFSDNGGSPLTGANNRPLRGSKYVMFEGGLRIPMMLKWPGKLPSGKTYASRISTLDILPTCLELAGLPVTKQSDGESFLTAVRNGQASPTDARPFFWSFQKEWAVRDGDWKLIKSNQNMRRKSTSQILEGPYNEDRPMLFNLRRDPAEQQDVYEQNPQVVKRLEKLRAKWLEEVKSGAGR
jgi:arylsulfatase A-like enzyme